MEFIAIDIFGPLTRTKKRSRFVIVMTSQYTKITRAVRATRIAVPQLAKVVLEDRIIHSGISDVFLPDNGKQFTSKFKGALCASFGTKLMRTVKCSFHCNGQVEM